MDDRAQKPFVNPFWATRLYRFLRGVFWIAFVLLPILTGWMQYDWHQNESFDEELHDVVETDYVEGPNGSEVERVEVWKDKKTGKEYSRADFRSHRRSEACRIAAICFAYGLVGCFVFAWARAAQQKSPFYEAFGKATLCNLAVAAYMLLKTWL